MPKVLVVHDLRVVREAIARMLRGEKGVEVFVAVNGLAGLYAAIHGKPDLIVTGLQMSRQNGIGMALDLRKRGTAFPTILYCEPLLREDLITLARKARIDLIVNERQEGMDGLLAEVRKCLAEAERKNPRKGKGKK